MSLLQQYNHWKSGNQSVLLLERYYEFAVQKQGIQRFRIVEDGSLTEAETVSLKG